MNINFFLEMQDIFVSYIIPCYNIQDYLPRCLNSLSSQGQSDKLNVEFILVNDGSTDNTLSLLREFEKIESRAVVIDQQNKGVSAARNAGLKVAKGKYVFFIDSDDWLTDDASQIIYDVCQNEAPDIVITNAYLVKEGERGYKREWNVCKGIDEGIYDTLDFSRKVRRLPISFKAYRRDFLLEHDICFCEELRVGEVYAFFLNALALSQKIAYTEKRIMNYLVRKDSVMRTVNLERDYGIITTIHSIEEIVKSKMPELLDYSSYKLGLYNIVNGFGINSYVKKSSYTYEIGIFLETIRNNSVYRKTQKYYMWYHWGLNMRTLYNILLYYFPVSVTYHIMRLRKWIKDLRFYH